MQIVNIAQQRLDKKNLFLALTNAQAAFIIYPNASNYKAVEEAMLAYQQKWYDVELTLK